MPAKRNILPHPCPECGSNYGSIRIAVVTGISGPHTTYYRNNGVLTSKKEVSDRGGDTEIIVRIKHYKPSGYATVKRMKISNPSLGGAKLRREFLKHQQKWCSFRINGDFVFRYEPRTMTVYRKLENLDYRKSIDWKPSKNFLEAVKLYGWNNLPRFSEKYRQHTSEYYSKRHFSKEYDSKRFLIR